MEDKETLEELELEVVTGEGDAAGEGETDEQEPDAPDLLTQAQQEAAFYKDRWVRLVAEFENYKKRTAREFEALVQTASEDVIRDLLPVLDAVGRALAHSENGESDSEGYREGVKMIMEHFPRVLQNRNLSEIETVGKPFDPNVHEALMQMPSETHEAGVVADVVERGYCLGDKVLRPAKVVVSLGAPVKNAEDVSEKSEEK